MGAERKSFYIDDKVKLMTAYHEVSGDIWVAERQVMVTESLRYCDRAVTRWLPCIPMVPCLCTR